MSDHPPAQPVAAPFPPASDKTKALQAKFKLAREAVRVGSTWRHYKGGIYKVTGHVFDTDAQIVKVRYERIDGPDFSLEESGIEFSRDVSEWGEQLYADSPESVEPINLPNVLDPEMPCEITRFVPVRKIDRYETEGQVKQRG